MNKIRNTCLVRHYQTQLVKLKSVRVLQATVFPGSLLFLLSLSTSALADISKLLYTGITHTSNLEVQTGGDINPNDQNLTRQGFETGISFAKQKLDYNGGYTLQANALLNKGISDSNDISNLSLSGSKLSVLHQDWLLRSNVGINWYDNEALPINSNKGLLLETTFGYLNQNGGGDDISVSLKREIHDQANNGSYSITRSNLGLTHYFSHKSDQPYWSLQATLKNNNANASNSDRDYNSVLVGTRYRQWSMGSFKGQIGLSWQRDLYDKSISISSSSIDTETPGTIGGNFMPPSSPITTPFSAPNIVSNSLGFGSGSANDNEVIQGSVGGQDPEMIPVFGTPQGNGAQLPPSLIQGQGTNAPPVFRQSNEITREDNLYYLSLQLDKSLSPTLGLQISAGLGRYDSTVSEQADAFYSIAAKLSWKF